MTETDDKHRMALTIPEILGIGTVVAAIITSFLLLRADVMLLSKDVTTLQGSVAAVIVEQAKIKTIVDLVYADGIRNKMNGNGNSDVNTSDHSHK